MQFRFLFVFRKKPKQRVLLSFEKFSSLSKPMIYRKLMILFGFLSRALAVMLNLITLNRQCLKMVTINYDRIA